MSCGCENRTIMCEYAHVSELARKAAILEQCIYVVYRRPGGEYGFDKAGSEIDGEIVEFRHYL